MITKMKIKKEDILFEMLKNLYKKYKDVELVVNRDIKALLELLFKENE